MALPNPTSPGTEALCPRAPPLLNGVNHRLSLESDFGRPGGVGFYRLFIVLAAHHPVESAFQAPFHIQMFLVCDRVENGPGLFKITVFDFKPSEVKAHFLALGRALG